jgi:hypothetical protein
MKIKELKNNRIGWLVSAEDFGIIKHALEVAIAAPSADFFAEHLVICELYKRAFCNPFVPAQTAIRLSWLEAWSFYQLLPSQADVWLQTVAQNTFDILYNRAGLSQLALGRHQPQQDLLAG